MPLMQWTDKLSVGIRQFDEEHKRLVGMINDLFDSMQAGKAQDVLGKILDGLVNYTKTHFANEERYFQRYGYPENAAHKAEHDALTKQVVDVQARYRAGASAVLSLDVMKFLKNWLTNHIQGTDKKYGPFLAAQGVK